MLTQHVTERAMGDDNAFYMLRHVDKRIRDMETRAVSDVALCATTMQSLLTTMLTPVSSAVFVTRLLITAKLPLSAISIIYLYALTGSAIVRFASPDLAGFAARSSQIEGVFRRMHQRLIANSESIAMIGGEESELHALNAQTDVIALEERRQVVAQMRFDSGNYWFNNYLPVLITNSLRMSWSSQQYGSADQIMAEQGGTGLSADGFYVQNLVTSGFTAVTGLLSINTTFRTLAGYTHRVTDLLLVIDEVRAERAQQTAAATAAAAAAADLTLAREPPPSGTNATDASAAGIALRDVEITAPDGKHLVSELSLTLAPGDNLRVTGPTGCGKTALFRVLAGIWHPQAGSVHVPPSAVMVSQQPLATTTSVSLLAYITYPQAAPGVDAQALVATLLQELGVMHLAEREGWDTKKLWCDVLSLGELQCLGCVRMLYHIHTNTKLPPAADAKEEEEEEEEEGCRCCSWAILDECTSALDAAVEESFFQYAAAQGISMVVFSDRDSAAQGDTRLLKLGAAGPLGWELVCESDSGSTWQLQESEEEDQVRCSGSMD
jgi:ABC-type uncharacterized transport system fused permease/ATPase subunit